MLTISDDQIASMARFGTAEPLRLLRPARDPEPPEREEPLTQGLHVRQALRDHGIIDQGPQLPISPEHKPGWPEQPEQQATAHTGDGMSRGSDALR